MKKLLLLIVYLSFSIINIQAQTVTDIDGNVYNTVTIGNQVWMKENLKTKHYRNGLAITEIVSGSLWFDIYNSNLNTAAWCYYGNDSVNNINYGKLYNWYAVKNSNNICPSGWHMPSDTEWHTLALSLDASAIWDFTESINAGGNLKATTLWNSPNTGANNSSGFAALPAGWRDYYTGAPFFNIGNQGSFWSSTENDARHAWARRIDYDKALLLRRNNEKEYGFSVRCIKDAAPNQINKNEFDLNFQLFPNPASDKIQINYTINQNLVLQVYNTVGDCLIQKDLNNSTDLIDISFLTKGIYILKFTNQNGILTKKLIKE